MKKIKFLLIILLLNGCFKDKDFGIESYTTCYEFVEVGTGIPMSNLNILIHFGQSNLLSRQGTTDENGIWCFNHITGDGAFAFLYAPWIEDRCFLPPEKLPMNGRTNIIELIPKSWIKFHIVNVEPSSPSDQLYVWTYIKIDDSHSYGEGRPFDGKDIDVYWNAGALKGSDNYINWEVNESGVIHKDTLTIYEHHDIVDYLIEY